MKKNLLFLFLLGSMVSFGQTLLNETFDAGFPPTDWTIDAHSGNWSAGDTNNAGGSAPEAKLSWNPSFDGTSRLISPVINTEGYTKLLMSFKHLVNDYSGGYTVGIATTSNGSDWHTVWTLNGMNIQEERLVAIDNEDVGSSTFQVCFVFQGNSYNLNYWYIDDVELSVPLSVDMGLSGVLNHTFALTGDVNVAASYKNYGLTTVTEMTMNYSVDGGEAVSETLSGLSLETADSAEFTFTTPWVATAGIHELKVWISNINGQGDDNEMTNNELTKNISVASQATNNLALFEEFTSSTCGPCATFNNSVFNSFMANNPDVPVIKYQMNWPNPGDPYYTPEGGVRRNYYGVSGVPNLFVGGKATATSNDGVNGALDYENAKNSYFVINATHHIVGDTFSVDVDITPYITGEFTLRVAVIEEVTTGNVGSNGETSFKHVMMKMLPDASGSLVNFEDGTNYQQTFSHDMSSTHVEEMDDLRAVVFIQFDESKEVMQSAYSVGETGSTDSEVLNNVDIYPNPSSGVLYLKSDKSLDVYITNMIGQRVFEQNDINANATLDINHLDNGVYLLTIVDGEASTSRKIILNK
ncbi:MAG: hypothetical protein CR968_05005 [Flavobacteriia bacterium]|nr:MAG: hypothetical protein CR968_05005 [Flavobacteriia bacterium]